MNIPLLGRWFGTIDTKRRITLPVGVRRPLALYGDAPQLIVTVGNHGCLLLVPDSIWDAFAPDLFRDAVQGDEGALRLRGMMARLGSVCRVDKSGRVTLTEEQMEFAGLRKGENAIVFANFNRVEIWEPARFEKAYPMTEPVEHDRLAALYFKTPTPRVKE